MAATNSATPKLETIKNPANNNRPTTCVHKAFGGRVVFEMTVDTIGDMVVTRRLYQALTAAANEDKTPLVDPLLKDDCANLCYFLTVTKAIRFVLVEDHIELAALRDLWKWYVANAGPSINVAELWNRYLQLGGATSREWEKAYLGGRASSLMASRELLPDEFLTPEELNDPN